jgi:ureidoacrylate peracid hydrolase
MENLKMANENAIILIDLVNDMVAPDGKLARRGYHDFITRHGVTESLARSLKFARDAGWLVVHVRVGFSPSYAEHPPASPMFGAAKQFNALRLGDPGTEFNGIARPVAGECVITKSRVSAFFGTNLESLLRINGVRNVYIAGVGTDMAVQSTARDAHDRDFAVHILADCCGASTDDDHDTSIRTLSKIGKIVSAGQLA